MTAIRVIYIIALGALLVALVAVGIWAFYNSPDYSHYGYDNYQAYHEAESAYHRNVLIIGYVIGLIFITLGMVLKERWNVMRSGLLLGGLLTLIYAISQAAGDVSKPVMFTAIFIGLVVVITLGLLKLVPRRKRVKSTTKEEDV